LDNGTVIDTVKRYADLVKNELSTDDLYLEQGKLRQSYVTHHNVEIIKRASY